MLAIVVAIPVVLFPPVFPIRSSHRVVSSR